MLSEPEYEQTTSHSISTREAKKRARSSDDFTNYRPQPSTEKPTTTLSSNENRGCLVDGTYYEEGEQLPTNKTNGRCETCYCVENAKACVIQQCDLSIPGCTPRYKKDACCPYKYDCRKLNQNKVNKGLFNYKIIFFSNFSQKNKYNHCSSSCIQ